jgi:hypothetical protein
VIEKSILKFIWKQKKTTNNQGNIEQTQQSSEYHNIWLLTILQSHSNKNSMALHKTRHEGQWNRIEDPYMNPHSYTHLIFYKRAKNMMKKDRRFSKCCWENWISALRQLKLYSCLSLCASTNSKWIKDINIRPETLKLGNTLELNRTQIVEKLRQRLTNGSN